MANYKEPWNKGKKGLQTAWNKGKKGPRSSRRVDYVGKTFGRWTVVARGANTDNGMTTWDCVCECGTTRNVQHSALYAGASKSCGCLQKQESSKRNIKDITGKTYGRLTVLSKAKTSSSRKVLWNCQCECTNTCVAWGSDLRLGKQTSCGCFLREVVATRNLKQHLQGTKEHGFLYVAILSNQDESFLKVGFAEDIEMRTKNYETAGFVVNGIHSVYGPKQFVLTHEAIIHGRDYRVPSPVAHHRYRPSFKFGGYTECFQECALLELCEYLDDMSDELRTVYIEA